MDEKFEILTDREHVCKRIALYLGSPIPEPHKEFVNGQQKELVYPTALRKMLEEIIDNSVTEHIRSGLKMNIDIFIDKNQMTCKDNGRGIPVEKINGRWRPEIAWTELRAGTSFSGDQIGLSYNGVGASCSNILSREFVGVTSDGKNEAVVTCTWNMTNISTKTRKCARHGTSVFITPDLDKFSCKEIPDDCIDVINSRIHALAISYPGISFSFNDKKIKYKKPEDYLETFGSNPIVEKFDNGFVAILKSDEEDFQHYSAINGLVLTEGGSHISWTISEIVSKLKEKIKKKYKIDLFPSEIKNGLKLIVIGTNFQNMQFNSQTKESLKNSNADVQKWFAGLNLDKLAKRIFESEDIITPIIELKLAKQAAIEKRQQTMLAKKNAKKYVKKHIEANSTDRSKCVLFLTEGDSAAGQLEKVRDPKTEGGLPLRGFVMNTYNMNEKQILENQELSDIMAVLGLSFGQTDFSNLNYGTIGILTDQDIDGWAIRGLLMLFFNLWPGLFQEKRIKIINSPLIIAEKAKTKKYYYTKSEYEKDIEKLKGYRIRYCKGLGSLREDEYRYSIDNKEKWEDIEIDDNSCFATMYADANVNDRKKLMGE